jgi:hypothetical protein
MINNLLFSGRVDVCELKPAFDIRIERVQQSLQLLNSNIQLALSTEDGDVSFPNCLE